MLHVIICRSSANCILLNLNALEGENPSGGICISSVYGELLCRDVFRLRVLCISMEGEYSIPLWFSFVILCSGSNNCIFRFPLCISRNNNILLKIEGYFRRENRVFRELSCWIWEFGSVVLLSGQYFRNHENHRPGRNQRNSGAENYHLEK